MNKSKPNYKRIYSEILQEKHPEKIEKCERILNKAELTSIDVIRLNKIIFNIQEDTKVNRRHSFYDKNAVFEILKYQKKNQCTNTALSKHFHLSRNTITKWKRLFSI
ncbi:helix-turn-helix domain-containing protein [Chryseobacterium oryctis]|uniref:Helix-turn-helix domain-containing protein n=1 Tax=Chryseobacterium oryctis TaxID=2952618 RepID=A0ABT3HSL3_9FLAO|nr:helix-turn-helix domain-containing protein [Chryseobacterium oryctis]MCW3162762.1 helix-turn-helix domain-containing protein [Chryseobacterium oryctis]